MKIITDNIKDIEDNGQSESKFLSGQSGSSFCFCRCLIQSLGPEKKQKTAREREKNHITSNIV